MVLQQTRDNYEFYKVQSLRRSLVHSKKYGCVEAEYIVNVLLSFKSGHTARATAAGGRLARGSPAGGVGVGCCCHPAAILHFCFLNRFSHEQLNGALVLDACGRASSATHLQRFFSHHH